MLVSAEATRDLLADLEVAGIDLSEVSQATNIARKTLRSIVDGRTRKVRAHTHELLLALAGNVVMPRRARTTAAS
jgi:lambda repressor-like predicted transcriptional regulator